MVVSFVARDSFDFLTQRTLRYRRDVGDTLVVQMRNRGQGRHGIELEARPVLAWAFSGDRVTSIRLYQDLEEAKAAELQAKTK